MKLEVVLKVLGEAFSMKVLYMDERFRSPFFGASNLFLSSNGVCIVSKDRPRLDETVSLWGFDKSSDSVAAVRVFDSRQDAMSYKGDVLEALREWAISWPGFVESKVGYFLGDRYRF